mmetsp:Transcript_14750/g.30024  ORF Transcript_14750/g.30024 Transcript_14750/m.30024 type:complete len:311 (+) Transcript_14750:315-1247(+)
MCNVTARPGFELSSELPSSTAAIRFSMKLPRYHHHHFPPSQAQPQGHVHVHARAAPSAPNHDGDPAVHSANVAASSRKAKPGAGSIHGYSHHGRYQHRSRSQESAPLQQLQQQQQQHFQPVQITQILPIPCNGLNSSSSTSPSVASSVDKSDLTRMYDYATWNMYDRIVSARRSRLASAMAAAKNGAVAAATASRELCHGKDQGKGETKTAATFFVDSTAAAAGAADTAIAKNAKATSATPKKTNNIADLGSGASSTTSITFESDYYNYSTASSSASAASSFGMDEAAQLQATTNPDGDHEDHFIFHMEM